MANAIVERAHSILSDVSVSILALIEEANDADKHNIDDEQSNALANLLEHALLFLVKQSSKKYAIYAAVAIGRLCNDEFPFTHAVAHVGRMLVFKDPTTLSSVLKTMYMMAHISPNRVAMREFVPVLIEHIPTSTVAVWTLVLLFHDDVCRRDAFDAIRPLSMRVSPEENVTVYMCSANALGFLALEWPNDVADAALAPMLALLPQCPIIIETIEVLCRHRDICEMLYRMSGIPSILEIVGTLDIAGTVLLHLAKACPDAVLDAVSRPGAPPLRTDLRNALAPVARRRLEKAHGEAIRSALRIAKWLRIDDERCVSRATKRLRDETTTSTSSTTAENDGGSKTNDDGATPSEFVCPITHATMIDPVVASDGHSYERWAIEEHMHHAGGIPARSPMTREVLEPTVVSNINLRKRIRVECGEC